MKIAGLVLMWTGALYLLQNLGIIAPIGWSVVWPVAIIILGVSLKHCKYPTGHGMMCAVGGKCGECGKGDGHKCEGENCGTCKIK